MRFNPDTDHEDEKLSDDVHRVDVRWHLMWKPPTPQEWHTLSEKQRKQIDLHVQCTRKMTDIYLEKIEQDILPFEGEGDIYDFEMYRKCNNFLNATTAITCVAFCTEQSWKIVQELLKEHLKELDAKMNVSS